MTPYERGYAAGQEEMRRRAAETCKKMAKVFATTDRYAVLSGAADACGSAILSLPIEGEAEGSGPGVVVPVEELKIVLDFFRKANWPDTRAGNAAYRLNNAMLAAAREEHSQHLRNEGLRISAESVDAVDREEHDARR